MKKKSIMARVGVLALALTLVTSSLTSGTLARYTDSQDIFAKAIVAKWAFKKDVNYAGATVAVPFELQAQNNNSAVASGRIAPGTTGKFPISIDLTGSEVDILMTAKISMCNAEGKNHADDGDAYNQNEVVVPAGLKFYLASDIKYATENSKPLTPITISNNGDYVDLLKTNSDAGKVFKYSPTGAETKWEDEIVWKWDYLAANDDDDKEVGKKDSIDSTATGAAAKQYALYYKIKINAVQTNSSGTVADENIPVA